MRVARFFCSIVIKGSSVVGCDAALLGEVPDGIRNVLSSFARVV